MDFARFDYLARSVATRRSRRTFARVLGFSALTLPGLGEARKKKRKRKKQKRKVKFNELGCVNVGRFCTNSEQCCSGICRGGKGKKTCQPHDASTCEAGQTDGFCSGIVGEVGCVTSTDGDGVCLTTTGNGPYCAISGGCFPCKTDADCVPFCGPAAACIVCAAGCADVEGTMCAGPGSGACSFP